MKKRILKIISAVIVFIVLQQTLSWVLTPVSFVHWVNHDIKQHRTEIDTVFLGASHMYIGLDPKQFDSEAKISNTTLNCGTTSQSIAESYYYLKDLLSYCPNIKNVFLDTYTVSFMELPGNATDLQRKVVLSSRLNNPLYKSLYAVTQFKADEFPNFLFRSIYYNNKIYEAPKNIRYKLSDSYRNFDGNCEGLYEPYYYMGYIPYNKPSSNNLTLPEDFELSDKINDESFNYLNKIIKLCSKKGLNLYLMQLPVADDAYNKEMALGSPIRKSIEDIAQKNNIPYIDLNEPRIKYFILTPDDFYDSEHLTITGSQKITHYIAEEVNAINGNK